MTGAVDFSVQAVAASMAKLVQLSDDFCPFFLYGATGPMIAEVYQALQPQLEVVIHVPPGADMITRLRREVDQCQVKRPVLWISQGDFEPAAWRHALVQLNMQRDWFATSLPVLLVLAGPESLRELIMDHAPDLASFAQVGLVQKSDKPKPKWPNMKLLHLSGLLFGDDYWNHRRDLRKLMEALRIKVEDSGPPDMVLIGGDIVSSGSLLEYQTADYFFEDLAKISQTKMNESWFLCPGLGDLDRANTGTVNNLLKSLSSEAEFNDLLHDWDVMSLVGRRLQSFIERTRYLLGESRQWDPRQPWRVDPFFIGDVEIAVCQANSVWSFADNDRGVHHLGQLQLDQLNLMSQRTPLRMVLSYYSVAQWAVRDGFEDCLVLSTVRDEDSGADLFRLNAQWLELEDGLISRSGFDKKKGDFQGLEPLYNPPRQNLKACPGINRKTIHSMMLRYGQALCSCFGQKIDREGWVFKGVFECSGHVNLVLQQADLLDLSLWHYFYRSGHDITFPEGDIIPLFLPWGDYASVLPTESLPAFFSRFFAHELLFPVPKEVIAKFLEDYSTTLVIKASSEPGQHPSSVHLTTWMQLWPKCRIVIVSPEPLEALPPEFEVRVIGKPVEKVKEQPPAKWHDLSIDDTSQFALCKSNKSPADPRQAIYIDLPQYRLGENGEVQLRGSLLRRQIMLLWSYSDETKSWGPHGMTAVEWRSKITLIRNDDILFTLPKQIRPPKNVTLYVGCHVIDDNALDKKDKAEVTIQAETGDVILHSREPLGQLTFDGLTYQTRPVTGNKTE